MANKIEEAREALKSRSYMCTELDDGYEISAQTVLPEEEFSTITQALDLVKDLAQALQEAQSVIFCQGLEKDHIRNSKILNRYKELNNE